MPIRSPNKEVVIVQCQTDYACLDLDNFKNLLKNSVSTEIYIEQLQNLLNELAEPVQE